MLQSLGTIVHDPL